jgi:hypothetical protein
MANYSVNTCFHLDWPKEACDSLKTAIACVLEEKDPDSPEMQSLGTHAQEVILRFLESYEPLGMSIEDHPDNGVIVKDEDGLFAPYMTADLLSAIMKDHGIEGVVSFTWAEDCDKHRLNAFAGGGAVVSANGVRIFHVSDWVEKTAQEMREDLENNPPAP